MRELVFFLLFTAAALGVAAQRAAKVSLRPAGAGRVTLARGPLRSTVDLSKNVAGCAYAGAEIRKRFRDCAASPATFKIEDETVKNGQTFLLLSTDAAGNCNVCGRCGADDAFGLVWLKLDRNLKLLAKQNTPIDFCLLDVTLVSDVVEFNEETGVQRLRLKFAGDLLALDFEKRLYEENGPQYEFSHLEYDRKTPEKGFVIKTEKRDKSSLSDQ